MKDAFASRGRSHSSHGRIRMKVIRHLAAVRAVNYVVTATISRLEHGEEVDASALLRRSAAARDDANRFIEGIILQIGCAMKRGTAEEAACLG